MRPFRKGRSLRSFVRVPPLLRRDITLTSSLHYLPLLRPPMPHSLQPPACSREHGCRTEVGYSRTRLCHPPRSVVECSTWNAVYATVASATITLVTFQPYDTRAMCAYLRAATSGRWLGITTVILLLLSLGCSSGYVTTMGAAPLLSPLRSVRSSLGKLSPRSRPPPLLRRDLVRSLPRDPLSFSRSCVATSLVPLILLLLLFWLIVWKKWYIIKIICVSR